MSNKALSELSGNKHQHIEEFSFSPEECNYCHAKNCIPLQYRVPHNDNAEKQRSYLDVNMYASYISNKSCQRSYDAFHAIGALSVSSVLAIESIVRLIKRRR